MNPAEVLLIACLAIVLIGLVYALIAWRAGYGTGHVLEGIGLAGLSVGLYLTGLMQLVYDLLGALVLWARALVWTIQVQTGIGLLAVAVVLWVIAGMLNRRGVGVLSKEDKQARRDTRAAAKADKQAGKAAAPTAGKAATSTTTPKAVPGPQSRKPAQGAAPAGPNDDLDEIEAILRKRGIE